MSDFETAVAHVLALEGGLVDNPNDSGGITNFGISLRFLRGLEASDLRRYGIFEVPDEQTVRNLVLDQAKFIYRGEFWEKSNFEQITVQNVCDYIFDMAISLGVVTAIRLCQRAISAKVLTRDYVKEDGILGPHTLASLNAERSEILPVLIAVRCDHYRCFVELYPKNSVFLNGWINRCFRI